MKISDLNQSDDIKKVLHDFSLQPRGFILLSGKNGTGKSFAARAVYDVVSPCKLPAYDLDIAYFLTQSQLNILWQKNFKDYGQTHYLLKILTNTKLLILDDLGTRTPSDPFMDFLYETADQRFELRHSKGTIITTNLNHADMREKFGDAFVSRAASGKCFRLDGDDRRFIPQFQTETALPAKIN